MEALALIPAGMPKGSFSLVLDAGPASDLCSDIFRDVVRRDAAWQTAWQSTQEQSQGDPSTSHFISLRKNRCCKSLYVLVYNIR